MQLRPLHVIHACPQHSCPADFGSSVAAQAPRPAPDVALGTGGLRFPELLLPQQDDTGPLQGGSAGMGCRDPRAGGAADLHPRA